MDKYNSWIGKLFGFFNGSKEYAVTFGQTTYYSCSKPIVDYCIGDWWRVHENQHKIQYKRDGWIKFLSSYIRQLIMKGYLAIDYEIEARVEANKVGGPLVGDCSPRLTEASLAIVLLLVAILIYGIFKNL